MAEPIATAYERMSTAPCPGFRWVGQSFASCDGCGEPYWKHSHIASLEGGPFDGAWRMKVIDTDTAVKVKRKWG